MRLLELLAQLGEWTCDVPWHLQRAAAWLWQKTLLTVGWLFIVGFLLGGIACWIGVIGMLNDLKLGYALLLAFLGMGSIKVGLFLKSFMQAVSDEPKEDAGRRI